MQYQELKISSSGQDLGGDIVFPLRLGFSGTPSNLLPRELGECQFAKGVEAQILQTLLDPNVATLTPLPADWSVEGALDAIAQAQPPYLALIDTGALVTSAVSNPRRPSARRPLHGATFGLHELQSHPSQVTGYSNLGVAKRLLERGLTHVDGVVFLDAKDRQMLLLRAGGKIVPLAQSALPWHRRFTFYDQVHTTGMDIKQSASARAALTLGKDMTFRDLAQGAYRMRGIGKGQTVEYLAPPTVLALVERHAALGAGTAVAERHAQERALSIAAVTRRRLRDVAAWLHVNSMRSETIQFNLLCEQSLHNVFRKCARRANRAGMASNSASRATRPRGIPRIASPRRAGPPSKR